MKILKGTAPSELNVTLLLLLFYFFINGQFRAAMGIFNNGKQDRVEVKSAMGEIILIGTPAIVAAVAVGSVPVAIGVGFVVFMVISGIKAYRNEDA